MTWPAHRLAELRQLRSEGLSTGEIAQRLGVSKTYGAQADQPAWQADVRSVRPFATGTLMNLLGAVVEVTVSRDVKRGHPLSWRAVG